MDDSARSATSSGSSNTVPDGPVTAAEAMTLRMLRTDDVVTVVVSGDVDLLTVDRLGETITAELAGNPDAIVIDLDEVEFLGSTGLTALALAERAASRLGVQLRVVASTRRTLRPLQVTGMTEQLAVYRTRDEALRGPFLSSATAT